MSGGGAWGGGAAGLRGGLAWLSGVMRRRNSTYSSVWKNVISSGVSSSGVNTWRAAGRGRVVRAALSERQRLRPPQPPRASICPTRSYFSSRSCVMRIRCGFIGWPCRREGGGGEGTRSVRRGLRRGRRRWHAPGHSSSPPPGARRSRTPARERRRERGRAEQIRQGAGGRRARRAPSSTWRLPPGGPRSGRSFRMALRDSAAFRARGPPFS